MKKMSSILFFTFVVLLFISPSIALGEDVDTLDEQLETIEIKEETTEVYNVGPAKKIIGPTGVTFPNSLHSGSQGKHIVGHHNYQPGAKRSIFPGSLVDANRLLSQYSSKSQWVTYNKQRFSHSSYIGRHIDPDT